jgi:CelD/BcsL family acetyltransferase involved in cellulose biosynthesis
MWKTTRLDHFHELMNPPVQVSPSLEACALTGADAFDLLQAEWDELLDSSDQRTFFLRWSWTSLWWKFYAPPGSSLLIITCRDRFGRLVGLAPLYRRQVRVAGIPALREVLFLGTGIFTETSHYLDVIARRGFEQAVAYSVADYLAAGAGWDRMRLQTVPASSKLLHHLQKSLPGAEISPCDSGHAVDTSTDWETLLAGLGKSTRANVIRYTRKILQTYECEFRRVETEEEFETAFDALVTLHQARWQSLDEPGSFALPGFEAFLREASRASLSEGRLRLWTLSLDGRVAAAKIAFLDGGVAYAFQQGFDPAHLKEGLGRVHSSLCIKACVDDDLVTEFDFMGGEGNQYKESWSRTGRETVNVTWKREGIRLKTSEAVTGTARKVKSLARSWIPTSIRLAIHRRRQRRLYSS